MDTKFSSSSLSMNPNNNVDPGATPPPRERTPLPPSASSSSQLSSLNRNLSNATSGASLTSNAPVTVDALLVHHVNAPNPTHAALEQAVHERNALSAQNSQLWKLIERQRAAYNTLLKENDRIRGDRDSYKSKLLSVLEPSRKRDKEREGEKNLRPATSTPSLAPTDTKAAQAERPGNSLASGKDQQEDPPQTLGLPYDSSEPSSAVTSPTHSLTPRSDSASPKMHPNLQAPRPQELADRQPHPTASNEQSQQSQKTTAPPPLLAPKRADSLPIPESTASVAKLDSPSRKYALSNEPFQGAAPYVPTFSTTVQPLQVIRKPGVSPSTDNTTVVVANVVDRHLPSPSVPVINLNESLPSPSHSHSQSQPVLTPAPSPQSPLHQPSLSLPQNDTSQPSSATSFNTPSPQQLTKLSPYIPDIPNRQLSRESRVTIPFEARQYMMNMESPVPSPTIPQKQTPVNDIKRSEPPTPASPHTNSIHEELMVPKPVADEVASGHISPNDFLDLDTEDDGLDLETEEDAFGTVGDAMPSKKGKARADDFPLPPSHPPGLPIPIQAPAPPAVEPSRTMSQPPRRDVQQPALQLNMPAGAEASDVVSSSSNSPAQSDSSPVKMSPLSSFSRSASFRALPLLPNDLPYTRVQVTHSTVRPNDRGKEVLSFVVLVDPGNNKDSWKVEKLYSDVLGLDQRIRATVSRNVVKKIGSLPEGKIWRDHAPAKADQRKVALEQYLQSLVDLPIKNKDEVIAFFTSDIVRETHKPVTRAGYKEGYLTKKGKNFGGWKTRFFVLQGPMLEYYESRGGAHLGSIQITGAQIGRQQRGAERTDGEKEYRHAFLIIESKRAPGGGNRHVLCAESDEDRDAWVDELVRYVMGTYNEEGIKSHGHSTSAATDEPRTSTSSWNEVGAPAGGRRQRGPLKDDSPRGHLMEIAKGSAMPISQLPQDPANAKLHNTPNIGDLKDSPIKDSAIEVANAKRILYGNQVQSEAPLSSSLPTSSPLDGSNDDLVAAGNQRSNSELGHYADMQGPRQRHPSRERKPFHPTLQPVASSSAPEPRVPTPDPTTREQNGSPKVKISGPMNGTLIPPGYKFGKEAQQEAAAAAALNDRKDKAKSRSFWNFGRPNDKPHAYPSSHVPRAVFGVTLDDAVEVAEIDNLPAIVYRCIEYLQVKRADQEEGIYRLSGSTAVIKSLKDRFNTEGDIDLLSSDEYWDPHAIAGLLKCFLRELPASILTRELHLRFLAVIDFVDPQERIDELSQLIKSLPLANYSLLRALTAHLVLVVQNSTVNKMTMRNVGIVFSPTLGIPAGVFSLMLCEFNRVFHPEDPMEPQGQPQQTPKQSSYQHSSPANPVHPPNGNNLAVSSEEAPSDSDDPFNTDESGPETTEFDQNMPAESSSPDSQGHIDRHQTTAEDMVPHTPKAQTSKASQTAANLRLNLTLTSETERHSRMLGLPTSPRPLHSPSVGSSQELSTPSPVR